MAIDKSQIKYRSGCIPGIARLDTYEYLDIVYSVMYDGETNKMVSGDVKMFDGVSVCTVYPDGSIRVDMPTGIANDHRGLMWLIEDLQRLDEFLVAVVENYH